MSAFLCKTCITQFSPVTPPLCLKCGITFNTINDSSHLCHECINSKKYFNRAYSFGIYNRVLKKLIHQFKYNGMIHLAEPFGIFLFYTFYKNHGLENTDIITPVPLHIKKLRHRGYNQSYLLIRKWPYFLKTFKKNKNIYSIKKELLIRLVPTISQTKLNKKQRKLNVKNAFKINPAYNIRGKKILMVDDIFTSGQTADECAKVLMQNHAASVNIITLSRSVKEISC
jgi:ComF family protein